MSTMMALIAKFGTASSIPTDVVARDYFRVSQRDFLKALKSGTIDSGNLDLSQISRDGIPLIWLSEFIETRRALAIEASSIFQNAS